MSPADSCSFILTAQVAWIGYVGDQYVAEAVSKEELADGRELLLHLDNAGQPARIKANLLLALIESGDERREWPAERPRIGE